MKTVFMLAALAALTASAAPGRTAEESLMDEIERQVRLPEGAEPLQAYRRYYAFDGKGRVEARYLLPTGPLTPDPLPADWGCTEVVIDGDDLAGRDITCPPDPDTSGELRAGQRRWVADPEAMPMIFDGGCMVVHVDFDLKTRKAGRAFCNGHA